MADTFTDTSATPRVTPTISQSIRIDWGSWLAQAAAHEAPIIEAAVEAGAKLALSQVPFGSIVASFIGPQLIDQYVQMGITALSGATSNLVTDVPSNSIFATVANLINANEPAFASFIGDKLDPMIKAGLAKVGVNV